MVGNGSGYAFLTRSTTKLHDDLEPFLKFKSQQSNDHYDVQVYMT